MQTSTIILCILALFCLLTLAMLLFFFYKNGERLTKKDLEYRRLEQQKEESKRKILEAYRDQYLKALKEKEKKQEYIDALKKLIELSK